MNAGRVSLFESVTAKENKSVEISEILDAIRGGRWRQPVEVVRAAFARGGKEAAQPVKKKLLPAVTPSGTFNGPHKAEALAEHSGMQCLDFDDLNGSQAEVKLQLAGDPFCYAMFDSPSNGLKFWMRIKPNADEHGRTFDAAADYFKQTYNLAADKSGRDVCRLCFVSYDPDLVHNPDAAIFEPPPAQRGKPPPAPGFDDHPDRARIEDALKHISADCPYGDWLKIGMALHSWSPSEGRVIWDIWSQKAKDGRYQQGLTDKKWETFHPGGITIRTLFKMAIDAGWKPAKKIPERTAETAAVSIKANDKPVVILPHGAQSISEAGRALGGLLAETKRFFIRGGAVAKLTHDSDGLPVLDAVKPATLASDFEAVAVLCKIDQGKSKQVTCPEQTAKLIAASTAFHNAMSPITVLTRCPVLIDRAGKLMQICGYDRQTGILAAGQLAEAMDIVEARRLLCEILSGFKFATPSDRARALAAMLTPALIFGGLLKGRAPVDLGEADASQSGKGYRNKLTAAMYAQSVKSVTQRKGGVGSMEESFNSALIRAANFIALDNVRGKIDSPAIESFLTEDNYTARAAFVPDTEIDPRRVVIMLTSNKADLTLDFANRCSCVRILKQPDGYAFRQYQQGDILEHVRDEQSRYLGAVFSIIYAWDTAGRPKTNETRHDFRPWAQVLDWITQNLLDAGPLLDGHRETQARMTNPVLNWLRDVALEIIRAKQANSWLRASDLVDLLPETGIETPGLPEHGDLTDQETRKAAQQATGRKLGLCFRAGDILTLDGMMIQRREQYDTEGRTIREYQFTVPAMKSVPIGGNTTTNHEKFFESTPEQAKTKVSPYSPAIDPAMEPAIKYQCSPSPSDTSLQPEHSDSEKVNIVSIGTFSGLAGKPETEEGEI